MDERNKSTQTVINFFIGLVIGLMIIMVVFLGYILAQFILVGSSSSDTKASLSPTAAMESAVKESAKNENQNDEGSERGETTVADTTEESTTPRDTSYLDQMIFLGDSRIVAMVEQGLIKEENAFAENGISHTAFMDTEFTDKSDGVTGTIDRILSSRSEERIYIALGINGVAFMDHDEFLSTFGDLIELVTANSNGATIIVQSILPICREGTHGSDNLTNANIDAMNVELEALALEKNCKFIDPSSALKNDQNELDSQYDKGDGLHFSEAGYEKVYEYILDHPVK